MVGLHYFSQSSRDQIKTGIEDKLANFVIQGQMTLDTPQRLDDLYNTNSDIDLCLFEGQGTLRYWSNAEFVPDYQDVASGSLYISVSAGDFLVLTKTVSWQGIEEGLLVAYTPIRRNYGVRNEYLAEHYNDAFLPSNVVLDSTETATSIVYQEQELFKVTIADDHLIAPTILHYLSILFATMVMILLLISYRIASWIQDRSSFVYGLIALFSFLLAMRLGVHVLANPLFDLFRLFRTEIISEGWFFYTLGDAVFNIVFICIWVIYVIDKTPPVKSDIWSRIWAVLFNTLSYLVVFWFAVGVRLIQRKSKLSLDITTSLQFDNERLIAFGLIVLIAGLYFLVQYLAYNLTIRSFDQKKIAFLQLAIALALTLLSLVFAKPYELVLVNAGFTFLIYFFRIPNSFSTLKFGSINFLIFSSIVLASVGAVVIYKSQERNDRNEMQRFISYLQVDRDIEGEYILSDMLRTIETDEFLKSLQKDNSINLDQLAQHVRHKYFTNYFSDYETDLFFFDKAKVGLNGKYKGVNVDSLKFNYADKAFGTAYPDIYYDGRIDQNKRKKYVCFLSIEGGAVEFSTLVIELRLKKFSSKRVLPRLLAERRVFQKSKFDYAHVIDREFQYISGNFPYTSAFDQEWLASDKLYTEGIERNEYMHLGARIDGKITLVSHPEYESIRILTNFSFLFVVQLVFFGVVALIVAFTKGLKSSNIHFSSKIMLYSVVSFVLPLVLVSLAVMQTTDSTNRKEIDNFNKKRTILLAENLDGELERYYEAPGDAYQISQLLNEMSVFSGMDFNLYDNKGLLLSSNTPEIFDKKIITEYLNPLAYKELIVNENEAVIADESVGEFLFKTSYVAINSPDSGKLLGVLASPYFASKNHVKRQQLQVFSNIINIFTIIFILSIVVAYWVITRLTQPISQIAERLHTTGFVQENRPLEWKADDEIGLLVREYNNMLGKLEDSKKELAQNEKEAAWREMAKQVAHEIKNPLTPMKLTLQHLRRLFKGEERDKKSLDILLGQIDTLDEIVTSFSHFAKMPIPDNKPFDIRQTLARSIELHVDKKIATDLEDGVFWVNGDRKLFGRVFNNIILNAFEAMRGQEVPKFEVRLSSSNERVLIEFADGGPGISEDIAEKVFIPNFSTKDSGSGIGLAVAKRGIEHAGGKIWFETFKGKGTTFYIELSRLPDQL